jgi:hypothetical protein
MMKSLKIPDDIAVVGSDDMLWPPLVAHRSRRWRNRLTASLSKPRACF